MGACLALGAVEVAFEGQQVVFVPPPEGTRPVGVLLWFPEAGGDATVDASWWRARGVATRGLAVAVPPVRLRWNPETDATYAVRLARELQRRLQLPPGRTLIGGEADGAAFAMHLATNYQDVVCGGALLVRGGLGGSWRAADADAPAIALYANANDPTVPIRSLRTIERRLRDQGYEVRFASAMSGSDWDHILVDLLDQLCAAAGVPLAVPAAPAPAAPAPAAPAPSGPEGEDGD